MHTNLSTTRKATPQLLLNQDLAERGLTRQYSKAAISQTLKTFFILKNRKAAYCFVDRVIMPRIDKNDLLLGKRLILTVSNKRMQEETGLSKSSVRRVLRELEALGLIAYCDSPNCKRYTKTDGDKRGIDFTPAVNRLPELAAQNRAMKAANARDKSERDYVNKLIRQNTAIFATLTTLQEDGRADYDRSRNIKAQALNNAERIDVLEAANSRLKGLQKKEIKAEFQTSIETVCSVKTGTHNKNTPERVCNKYMGAFEKGREGNLKAETSNSGVTREELEQWEEIQKRGKKFAFPLNSRKRIELVKKHRLNGQGVNLGKITLGAVVEACPQAQAFLGVRVTNWHDLTMNSQELQYAIGLKREGYEEALRLCGSYEANVLLLVVAELALQRPERVRNAAGLFRSFARKASTNELNLTKTLYGLKRASDNRILN